MVEDMNMASKVADLLFGPDFWPWGAQDLDYDLQGWNSDHPLLRLNAAAGGLIVEVGSWKGASTFTLAHSIRAAQVDGCVIAVDPWLPALFDWEGTRDEQLYRQFLNNMVISQLTRWVVPLRLTSVEAAQLLLDRDLRPRMVYLDASHDYQNVLRDIKAWWPVLQPGGVMIGDDYKDCWPGVKQAVADGFPDTPVNLDKEKWVAYKPALSGNFY